MKFALTKGIYTGLLFYCIIKLCEGMSMNPRGNTTLDSGTPSQSVCSPIKSSISEEVICNRNDEIVSCDRPEDNTTVRVRCREFYVSNEPSSIYRCKHGEWDYKFVPCNPDCGMKNSGIVRWITNDANVIEHEYPWVVAIFNKTDNFICGGTIISIRHVLSAAHCFSDNTGKANDENDYTILAGKHYRDMNISEESTQIRKIEILFIHEKYAGNDKKYRNDIALVVLNKEFTLTMQVQPVCIDWDNVFEDFDFVDGIEGIVTGWGYNETGKTLSDTLKTVIVPYRSRYTCLQNLPVDFGQEYFSSDKICAGYRNNNTVCQGDSGGGFYFKSDNKHFFIRGIVSISVKFEGTCDPNHYSLYTRISKYLPWIKAKVKASGTD